MKKLILKILSEYKKENKVISEMASLTWCKDFPKYKPEYHFCVAAEQYVKNELEDSPREGKRKGKKVFVEFEKGLVKFFLGSEGDEDIEQKILQVNENSPIFINGTEEINNAYEYLQSNCSKFNNVVDVKLNEFRNEIKLYFIENQIYSLNNRLPTNYSAIAVLFTMFFSKKGAFDGVRLGKQNWSEIAKNWITHSFNSSTHFEDIRPEDDAEYGLSSLSFQELCRIYFKGDVVFSSEEIKKSVNKVLVGVRGKGFESEDLFEKIYLKNKKEYIRYAKDYGFVDMFAGIDFIYKNNDGMYVPIQVKTTATEPTYLISKLGCKKFIIAEKEGLEFSITEYPKSKALPEQTNNT